MMMIFSVNLKCVMFCCLLWKANFSSTRLPTCSCFLSRFFGMKCNSSDVNLVPWWVCLMLYLCLLVCTFPSTEHLRLCWTSSLYKPCMFVTEVLLLCVCCFFFSMLVSSLFLREGEQTCDSRVKGECIILVCCQICRGQVFMTLSRLLGHCVRACQWWGDCMYYESYQQGWSDLLLGRDPVGLITTIESLKQEWKMWKLLCCQTIRGGVCKNNDLSLDMIYFDKKRLKWRQCIGGFLWCLHIE